MTAIAARIPTILFLAVLTASGCGASKDETKLADSDSSAAVVRTPPPAERNTQAATTPAGPSGSEAMRTLAAEIEHRAQKLERVTGDFRTDDTETRFMAYLDGEQIVLVETTVETGAGVSAFDTYYYDDSRLFRYQSFRAQVAETLDTPDQVLIEMLFAGDGALLEATTEINGQPAATAEAEIRQVQEQAEVLRTQVHSR